MSRHRNWHVHTHLAVAWCLTCEKCCLLCINAHCSCMSLFVKFSLYCTSLYYVTVHLHSFILFLPRVPSLIHLLRRSNDMFKSKTLPTGQHARREKPHLPRFDLINELPCCGTTAGEHGCAVAKRVPADLSDRVKLSKADQFSVQFSSLLQLLFELNVAAQISQI